VSTEVRTVVVISRASLSSRKAVAETVEVFEESEDDSDVAITKLRLLPSELLRHTAQSSKDFQSFASVSQG
jgi:hypothetical protein